MGTWVGAVNGGICNQGQLNPAFVPSKLGQGAADLVLLHSTTNNSTTGRALDDSSSRHTGGSNMLFADGSVHFVRSVRGGSTDSVILQGLGTIAGGEVISTDLW